MCIIYRVHVEGKNILNGRYELSTVLTSGSAVKPPFSTYDSADSFFVSLELLKRRQSQRSCVNSDTSNLKDVSNFNASN